MYSVDKFVVFKTGSMKNFTLGKVKFARCIQNPDIGVENINTGRRRSLYLGDLHPISLKEGALPFEEALGFTTAPIPNPPLENQ